ncbi:hypothetical protein D3C85_1622730 [compost metagenome]
MQHIPVKNDVIIQIKRDSKLLQLRADRPITNNVQDKRMSTALKLGACMQQNIKPFGRHKPANRNKLNDFILMRNRLEPLLVEAVGDNRNRLRLLQVRGHIMPE